ncbi:MAG: BREX-1 system adenine-specific DNA-methyltransferase PglX [Spirochaetota bacterium]
MDLNSLKKFAQEMRRELIAQMKARIEYVLSHDDEYLRAHSAEKKKIAELDKSKGRQELVEEAAYLWFNRLAAFRYMDSRGYTSPRVISPRSGESQPELLAEIKRGNIPLELKPYAADIEGFLSGRIHSSQPDREAYKLALLGTCNAWAERMPWLFTKVDDWAGLLLPQDLLSENSVIARMVSGLSDADCKEGVEIIGWLYQFYISEKKDEVFALLKKNIKVSKENIPAATQLFTPHWIVRFMVENSLGRLWLLNRPDSQLKERMKYFIESDPEPDFLRVKDPTALKCLDPCCGSGHILAYFFELLYAIYEEEGYAPAEIPSLIIEHNIYGIDIDERAAELAAFTLAMVAREKDRSFFERGVTPHVTAMRDIQVDLRKLNVRLSPDLQESLELLKEGRNYGSLIPVPAGAAAEIAEIEAGIESHRFDDLFGTAELDDLKAAFRILEYLEPRYHVVVTNPPYINTSSMNPLLKDFVSKKYKNYKTDLFASFIVRCIEFSLPKASLGFMTPFVWMFISSYENLRQELLQKHTITSLIQLEYSGFEWATVPVCTFTIRKGYIKDYKGGYVRLSDFRGADIQGPKAEEAIMNPQCGWFYRADQRDFSKIPGSPIAYWVPLSFYKSLEKSILLESIADLRKGMCTRDNDYFVRNWPEVSWRNIELRAKSRIEAKSSNKRWFPYQKGGDFRQWYGNHLTIVDWENDGYRLLNMNKLGWAGNSTNHNLEYIFKPALIWSKITSSIPNFRISSYGFLYDDASGLCSLIKHDINKTLEVLSFLCSKVGRYLIETINPTLNIQPGDMSKIPIIYNINKNFIAKSNIIISKSDWDLRETSWDFRRSPLLTDYSAPKIETVIDENLTDWSWPSAFGSGKAIHLPTQAEAFKRHWTSLFLELHKNEEENNRIFIDLYGLQDELSPEVPYSEITILQEELVDSARKENRIEFDDAVLARQFVSYGVGCLFGRYLVEQDGLILADAESTAEDFKARVPGARFLPDGDGVLPLTDEDDFADDLPTAFKSWLRFISGEHYNDNLRWLEQNLGRDLRTYFVRDFYKEHIKRYKNRPIYWMISSPSGAFRALMYLHRYNRDTIGKVLNDYVRPYRAKLDQKIRSFQAVLESASESATEKSRAKKRLTQLEKYRTEIEAWERDHLYPLALKRIELDLDDGVKVNYRKLSGIVEPIKQLEAKDEE